MPSNEESPLCAMILLEQIQRKLWLDVPENGHEGMLAPLSVQFTDLVELVVVHSIGGMGDPSTSSPISRRAAPGRTTATVAVQPQCLFHHPLP